MNRDDASLRPAGAKMRHVALVIFFWSLAFLISDCRAAGDSPGAVSKLCIVIAAAAKIDLLVEIAGTQALRERGLMFRKELPADHGMLLWYPEPRAVNIWMKNTYIPLDIIFIDDSGTITRIVRRAAPLSETQMASVDEVRAVLEINAGRADELGIRTGDRVLFSEQEKVSGLFFGRRGK